MYRVYASVESQVHVTHVNPEFLTLEIRSVLLSSTPLPIGIESVAHLCFLLSSMDSPCPHSFYFFSSLAHFRQPQTVQADEVEVMYKTPVLQAPVLPPPLFFPSLIHPSTLPRPNLSFPVIIASFHAGWGRIDKWSLLHHPKCLFLAKICEVSAHNRRGRKIKRSCLNLTTR